MKKLVLIGAALVCADAFYIDPAHAQEDHMGDYIAADASTMEAPGGGTMVDEMHDIGTAEAEMEQAVVTAQPKPQSTPTPAPTPATEPQKSVVVLPKVGGFYFAGALGLSSLADADNAGPGLNVESNYNPGYQFAGALGLRFNKDFRVEAEIGYRVNDLDTLTVTSVPASQAGMLTGSGTGDVTATTFMLNAYGDMDVFAGYDGMSAIKPYIMGGIGMSHVQADVSSNGVQLVDDEDYAFTYQIGVGIGYSFDEATSLDLGYRYLATSDLEFQASNNGPQFDTDYNNHTFLLGIRHEFNRE